MPVHVRPPAALTRRPATGGGCRASPATGIAALQRKADASPATRRLAALKARLPEATGPVIQAKFADETTFGFEIEFKNRWISAYPLEKSVPSVPLDGNLAGWNAESDAGRLDTSEGRLRGTVLELESKPYTGAEIKAGTAKGHVTTAYIRSRAVAESSGKRPTVKSLEAAYALKDGDYSTDEKIAAEAAMASDHGKDAEATLQVTTLGKRTPEHMAALRATTESFDADLNVQYGYPDALSTAQKAALAEIDGLRALAAPVLGAGGDAERKAAELAFEDLAATISPLVQMLVILEAGMPPTFGTIKNLIAPVLPRRIVRPPDAGFAARFRLDAGAFKARLDGYLQRANAVKADADHTIAANTVAAMTDDNRRAIAGAQAIKAQLDAGEFPKLWALLAKGSVHDADTPEKGALDVRAILTALRDKAAARDSSLEKGKEDRATGGISLLHTVAESEPTLEDKIIAKAVATGQIEKGEEDQWAAHEIRNALYAQAMDVNWMEAYLDLLAGQS